MANNPVPEELTAKIQAESKTWDCRQMGLSPYSCYRVAQVAADHYQPKIDELVAALQFYADPKNWKLEIGLGEDGRPREVMPNAYFSDRGKIAQQALARHAGNAGEAATAQPREIPVVVAGIELYPNQMGADYLATFSYQWLNAGHYEVLMHFRGERRFALCTHENDAQVIADALNQRQREPVSVDDAIERVARAIAVAGSDEKPEDVTRDEWEWWINEATAAIAAIAPLQPVVSETTLSNVIGRLKWICQNTDNQQIIGQCSECTLVLQAGAKAPATDQPVECAYRIGDFGYQTGDCDHKTQDIDVGDHFGKIQVHGDDAPQIAARIIDLLQRTPMREAVTQWIEWEGGSCPVGQYDIVELELRDTPVCFIGYACAWHWPHSLGKGDILRYRILHEPTDERRRGSDNA